MIHCAKITSPRLQRVIAHLKDGRWHTTRDILRAADVCAVNTVVSELRANGCDIKCKRLRIEGALRYAYKLINHESGKGREDLSKASCSFLF